MAATITRNCPKCGGALTPTAGDPTRRTCAGCGARFLLPSNPAPAAAATAPTAVKKASANPFADLDAPAAPAPRGGPAPRTVPAPRTRPAAGDSQMKLVLLLAGGAAVGLVGLVAAVVLAVVFWPRPAAQPTTVAAAPLVTQPTPPSTDPAPAKPPVADNAPPAARPNQPTLPSNDPPPVHDAPPPLQPTPPAAPPDVNPALPPMPPMPAPAPEVKADDPINKAIDKAVAYLKKEALNGPQANPRAGGFNFAAGNSVGVMGLIGLALLESGVPADDPSVAAATAAVRNGAATCSQTYEMSIAIWFLDRLGDPKDEDAIRDLGARLIAGQLEHGKWTYNCPTGNGAAPAKGPPNIGVPPGLGLMVPDLSQEQLKELMETLDKYDPAQEIPAAKRLAPVCKYKRGNKIEKVTAINPRQPGPMMMMIGAGDLSLTQFAVLGLWAARKHHLPVDRSLLLAEAHVRSVQAADGGWAYSAAGGLGGMGTTDSMTCSGLMELAAGRAVGASNGGKVEAADPQFEKGIEYLAELFDRGVPAPKPGDAQQGQNLQQAVTRLQPLANALTVPVLPGQKPPNWAKEAQALQAEVEKVLGLDLPADAKKDLQEIDDELKKALNGGAPKERTAATNLVQQWLVRQQQNAGLRGIGPGMGGKFLKPGKNLRNNQDDVYCLWSLERLAMVCDLKTIAGRDWYAWGAQLLIDHQNDDGSWTAGGICPTPVETCMGLLFLKRVNVAKDLTSQLKMIAPIKDLSPDKIKYVSPGDAPSPGETPPREAPKP